MLRVIQRINGRCNRSRRGIGCDDLEVATTNTFAPPFAHFRYRLAPDKAAEFGKESPIVADDEGPVASSDTNHIPSSKMVRRIPGR